MLIGIDGMTFLSVLIQSIWFNDNHHHHILICLLIIYTKASKRVYMYTYWKSRVLPTMHTKRERESIIQVQLWYTCVHLLTFSLYCIVSHFMHIIIIVYDWWEKGKTSSCSKFSFSTYSLAREFKQIIITIKRQKMSRSFFF